MSITVKNLTKIYGSQTAVDNISFDISEGQIVGFLGPNGAGKSTTMKMITSFVNPTNGSIFVNGIDVQKEPIETKKLIGYLPEHNPLYLDMYVREYLNFVAGVFKIKNKKARINEVIQLTGLELEQNKLIASLSKGYRQRVGLAQAILPDPAVLILDEPTSGLDPNQLVDIRSLIKKIGEKKTVIFSTHIMQEVQALCDRVIIIKNGAIVADQSIENLQSHFISQSKLVVKVKEKTTPNWQSINEVIDVKKSNLGWDLFFANTDDIRAEVFNFAVANKLTILEMYIEKTSVETVFQELTK